MSQVNALLGVLQSNGGDELILAAGAAPTFLDHGSPIKLFLRPLSAPRHRALLDELLDDAGWSTLQEARRHVMAHDAAERGTYMVYIDGAEGHRVRFKADASASDDPPTPTVVPPPAQVADSAAPAPPRSQPEPTVAHDPQASPELQQLLAYAAERGASDLHLATDEPATLRVDGRLSPLGDTVHQPDVLLAGVVTEADRDALALGQTVDRAVETPDGRRFRMNVYRHTRGTAAAFRVLRPAPPRLSRLDLPVDLRWVTELPHGLVLFCGPTGSGKSTTLAALTRELIEQRGGVVITLEDPIEYAFTGRPGALVRQREVGRHVPDFASGLRDALREDPDVLLVGEMRDAQSIQLALTAAETGHLVLASLHSRTAPSAVERIVDAYPPERQRQVRVQLADALRGVVSQRLVPRSSGSGRVPALEVMRVTHAAAACIRDGKTPHLVSVIQTGSADGMIPLDRCLRNMVAAGQITEDDAAAVLAGSRPE